MNTYESLSTWGRIPWRILQVSTHGHDRPIQLTPFLPTWKPLAARGLMHRDNVRIGPGETFEFPPLAGPGCIVNIWVTFMPFKMRELTKYHSSWDARKKLRIRIFFDGEQEPCVDSPIGDFFGVGFGEYKEFESKYLEERSGGYVCRFPMPFVASARVTITNTDDRRAVATFYGAITYKAFDDPGAMADPYYFHAIYRQEIPTRKEIPYKILDVKGEGFYAGMVLNIENTKRGNGLTFLEGNTKIYVDDGQAPSLEYTGTEDLFQGAWYYVSGEYSAPYAGLTVRSLAKLGPFRTLLGAPFLINKTSQYRFHEHDAVPFSTSILAFIHHGEFDEVLTKESSVTFYYAKKGSSINMSPLENGEFPDEYYSTEKV